LNRRIGWSLAALALVLLGGLSLFLYLKARPYQETVDHGPSPAAQANPYLAAEMFLRERGLAVSHAETLAVLPRIRERYGIEVEVYRPVQEAVIEFVGRHGERAMYESVQLRKGCCGVRKLEPLSRMLAERDAWITGMRREQSDNRGGVPFEDQDDKGRVKLNPLADWTWGDVWHYIKLHQVPYNALHDQFFPSIGCAPCTRAISLGEPFRAGRWWWEDESAKECGLHVKQSPLPA
jgi:phosphoadenosine phosphosulfate reductase